MSTQDAFSNKAYKQAFRMLENAPRTEPTEPKYSPENLWNPDDETILSSIEGDYISRMSAEQKIEYIGLVKRMIKRIQILYFQNMPEPRETNKYEKTKLYEIEQSYERRQDGTSRTEPRINTNIGGSKRRKSRKNNKRKKSGKHRIKTRKSRK
jgi:hypothetical protein